MCLILGRLPHGSKFFFRGSGIFKPLIVNILLLKPVYFKSALFFVASSSIFDIYVANEDVNNKSKRLKDNSEIYKSFQISPNLWLILEVILNDELIFLFST